MNIKKTLVSMFAAISMAALCTPLCACDGRFTSIEQGQDTPIIEPTEEVTGDVTAGNDVTEVAPSTVTHNFKLVQSDDESGAYTFKCDDCDEQKQVNITYVSGTPGAYVVTDNDVTFSGIDEDSVYSVSGDFYGNVVVNSGESRFELELNGFTVTSESLCPLNVTGDKVTISAKKGSQNYIYDVRRAVDENDESAISASVYAECDLNIQGKGELYVVSQSNNGIHTKDDLAVKNLTLQVDCQDNALKGNDSVTIESGALTLIARDGDGVKTKNSDVSKKGNQRGTVVISGGNVLIYAARDGIDASYDVEISGDADVQIFTDKFSKFTTQSVTEIKSDSSSSGAIVSAIFGPGGGRPGGGRPGDGMSGGGPDGMQEGNTDKSDISTKGIKADNAINVSGGNVTIRSYDDCIHANGDVTLDSGENGKGDITISGGKITVQSNDDGVHADAALSVTGGSVSVLGSYEGLEGDTVTVSGGDVTVVSSDDGINGTSTTNTSIVLSGGDIYVRAAGDGLDANSTTSYSGIVFSGSDVVVISTGRSDSSVDTERGYTYNAGKVVAIGLYGGMSGEATNTQTNLITTKNLALNGGGYLVVDGFATVKIPVSMSASVIVLGKADADISTSNESDVTLNDNGVYFVK